MTAPRRHQIAAPDGTVLHVADAGPRDAPAVVLLHGIAQSHLSWAPLLRGPLVADVRLVAPDLRGHGWSDKPPDGYGDERVWAADVAAVIEALGLDRPVLCGWSFGAMVALDHVAVRGADGLRALVLVGATPRAGVPEAMPLIGPEFVALLGPLTSEDAAEALAAVIEFEHLTTARDLEPEEEALLVGAAVRTPRGVRAQVLARPIDRAELLRTLPLPLHVVHGDADRVIGVAAAELVAALRPDVRLSIWPGAGHALFREDPEHFADELRAAL